MFGNSSDTMTRHLASFIAGKPTDGSDIETVEQAKKEICAFRELVTVILQDESSWSLEDVTSKRTAVMDKAIIRFRSHQKYTPPIIPKSDEVMELLTQAVTKNILFASYSVEEQNAIIYAHEKVYVNKGEYVIRQGENGDNFYIVETGELDAFVKTRQGDVSVGVKLGSGSAFGELALMYNAPRAASIKAATDCVLWSIHRKVYREIVIYCKYQRNKTYIDFLRNVEVLGKRLGSCLTTDELEKLAISMDKEIFNANDVIIRQGNVGNNFYILIDGEVDVYKSEVHSPVPALFSSSSSRKRRRQKQDLSGDEPALCHEYENDLEYSKVATLIRGNYFGEKALIKEDVRQASCVARTPVTCLTLGREEFIQMMGRLEDIVSDDIAIDAMRLSADASMDDGSESSGEPGEPADPYTSGEVLFDDANVVSIDSSYHRSTDANEPDHCGNDRHYCCSVNQLDQGVVDQSSSSSTFKISMFKLEQTIGKGAFGHVRVCIHQPTGLQYALKCLSKRALLDKGNMKTVLDEFRIMRQVSHPYIVTFHAAMQDSSMLYYLLELLPGGDLFTLLTDVNTMMETDARFYVATIVSAFAHLHSPDMRVAYRDLKPENIVLTERGVPKLIDFGLAKQMFTGKTFTICGTPDYLAPEVILNQGHNHAVDYWTLGIFMSELLFGQTPFAAETSMEVYNKILNDSPKLGHTLTRNAADLIYKLLKPEQGARLGNTKEGIHAIISHKWFTSFNWRKLESCELPAPFIPYLKRNALCSNLDSFSEAECEVDVPVVPCDWTPTIRI